MIGQFVLQVLGITKGRILSRPSVKLSMEHISDVLILKDNTYILTHTPSYGCTGMANSGCDVFVAPCPPDEDELSMVTENGETFTHTIFLAEYMEKPDNHQIIAINPKIAIELMESILEKNLISCLPGVKEVKRNVKMFLEGKVDSTFSFVGICDDDVPFVMEVSNVPFAEYKQEDINEINMMKEYQRIRIMRALEIAQAPENAPPPPPLPPAPYDDDDDRFYNLKTSYFPEINNKCVSPELIKRINEMANIAKESSVRCILGYVVERTDITKFEISKHNKEYYEAAAYAVASGVFIVPVVVSWTAEGVSFFVTDQLPVVQPTM